jgi:hypothetical protein
MAVLAGIREGERGRIAVEERGRAVEDGVRMASLGLLQIGTTPPHQSQFSWTFQWLPDDDPRRRTSLQMRVKRKAQQSWHNMWQALAPSPAPSTSIEAPPSTDVLALHQLLRKPETAMAVQLQPSKNGFNAFLYQARVPSVLSPLCSCSFRHQTAKHIIIHCRNFSAARNALRDDQEHLPDSKQLPTTPTGLQKVTKLVMQRGILGQYRWARVFLYPLGPSSPGNN